MEDEGALFEQAVSILTGSQLGEASTSALQRLLQDTTEVLPRKIVEAEDKCKEYIKRKQYDVKEAIRLKQEASSVKQQVLKAQKKAKRLRLGGSCMHGADQGPKCAKCMEKYGKLTGPYVHHSPGVEFVDYLYTVVTKGGRKIKKRKIDGKVLSENDLWQHLQRITDCLSDIDTRLKNCLEKLESNLEKTLVRLVIKRTPDAQEYEKNLQLEQQKQKRVQQYEEKVVIGVSDDEDAVGVVMKEQKQKLVSSSSSCTMKRANPSILYRSIHVHVVGNVFEFVFFGYDKSLSSKEAERLKNWIQGMWAGKATMTFAIGNVGSIRAVAKALIHKACGRWYKVNSVSVRLNEGNTWKMLRPNDNVFDLETCENENDKLVFKCIVEEDKEKNKGAKPPGSLWDLYKLLCSKWPVWYPKSELKPYSFLKSLLESANAANLDFANMALHDEHMPALLGAISCHRPGHLKHLNLSRNRIADFAPLADVLNGATFPNLQKLQLGGLGCQPPLYMGKLFHSIASGAVANSLAYLKLINFPIFRSGCTCDVETDIACFSRHETMLEVVTQFSNMMHKCRSLRDLYLDGCFDVVEFQEGRNDTILSSYCQKGKQKLETCFDMIMDGFVNGGQALLNVHLTDSNFLPGENHFKRLAIGLFKDRSLATIDFARCTCFNIEEEEEVEDEGQEGNGDKNESFAFLEEAFADPTTVSNVKTLLFRHCDVFVDGIGLAKLISKQRFLWLETLDLSCCNLSSKVGTMLFQSLGPNKTLKRLDINGNPRLLYVGSVQRSFLEMLSLNCCLERMSFQEVGIQNWRNFLSDLFANLKKNEVRSKIRAIELGPNNQEPILGMKVTSGELACLFDKSTIPKRLTHFRLWHPHMCVSDIENIPGKDLYPPTFDAFLGVAGQQQQQHQQSFQLEWQLYKWGFELDESMVFDCIHPEPS